MRPGGYVRPLALMWLCATLVMTGCTTSRIQCEGPTLSPEHSEPLPPLHEPADSSCQALLNAYTDNLATCAEWGARYRSLLTEVRK